MTIHLPPHIERSIQAAVQCGRFASLDEAMSEAASLLVERLNQEQCQAKPGVNQAEAASIQKPIWEVFQELSATVPDEVWDALPTDLSEQHDHYIYGTPKRPTA
jgi:Arc/MetJ-type ribon-helix-helix transcriptional regulator